MVFSAAYFLSSNVSVLRLTVHYFMYRRIALSLCFALFLGLLSACSPDKVLHLEKNESKQQKTSQKSENTQNDIKENTGIGTPIALPPSFNDRPLKPGQTKTEYMPNGLPALKPMKGVNIDTLFSENIKDSGKRFERVENAVIDLRKEFEVYKPAIVRLAAVESDIQNLIKELEVLLQETPAEQQQPLDLVNESEEAMLQVTQLEPQPQPPLSPEEQNVPKVTATPQEKAKPPPKATPPPEPEPQPPTATVEEKKVKEKKEPEKPDKPPPSERRKAIPKYDGIVVADLRAGEHVDKLRIVLDTNKHTDFSIDLDNNEKLIIIELQDARWKAAQNEKTFDNSDLLESYSVEPINNGKGSMIILSLKKETRIIQKKRLPPDENTPYHRIYFDLEL